MEEIQDIDKILKIGKKYNLHVLQDGAQSLGGVYNGNKTGANAQISTMSFHMAKILSRVEGEQYLLIVKNVFSN